MSGQFPALAGSDRQLRAAAVMLDIFIVGFSVMAAYALRFGPVGVLADKYLYQMMVLVPCLICARLGMNMLMGVYRVVWRYVGLRETLRFVRAVAVGSGIVSACLMALRYGLPEQFGFLQIPLSIILLEGTFTFVGITGSRFVPRIWAEHRRPAKGDTTPALLVGAGRQGLTMAREALMNGNLGIRPVGFLDRDPGKVGREVHGLRVYGTIDELADTLRRTGAGEIIITSSSMKPQVILDIVEQARALGVGVRIVSTLFGLRDFRIGESPLREVRIEDLLHRDPVAPSLSMDDLSRLYGGKRILVTGAGGSIGSELCRQLAGMNAGMLLLVERDETNLFDIESQLRRQCSGPGAAQPMAAVKSSADGATHGLEIQPILADICDRKRMAEVFRQYRPEVVFHAAAYKHVPMMERFPYEAVRNNVFGTLVLAELADEHGVASFVVISTDKAVRPSSVMGASKRLAEMVVQRLAARSRCQFSCVRFGNVLGSRGSVVPIFRQQIARGGPVTVTHAQARRYFMTTAEAANLVIQAGTLGENGEVYLLDMGEPVKILDLARKMIRLSGATEEHVPIAIVGLRPGEKLFEELRTDAERMSDTPLRKVFRCTLARIDSLQLDHTLERLRFLVRAKDGDGVRACLAELDIGYREEPLPRADGG